MKKPLRALILRPALGYSLPVQRDACRMKASQLGAVIAPEHEYVDAGESAKTADRDELQRMLHDIKTVRPDIGASLHTSRNDGTAGHQGSLSFRCLTLS